MPFLDLSDFCGYEEYSSGLGSRANEANICPDDLFMLMMALRDSQKEAAKQAVKVVEIAPNAGIAAVKFAFLDDDLEPYYATKEKMISGLFLPFEDASFYDYDDGEQEYKVTEAYLKDYFDDQFGSLQVQAEALV